MDILYKEAFTKFFIVDDIIFYIFKRGNMVSFYNIYKEYLFFKYNFGDLDHRCPETKP